MSEKELEQNRKEVLKKACIGNGIMLSLIAIAIVLAVFAWFTSTSTTARLKGVKMKTFSNYNIQFETHAASLDSSGSLHVDLGNNSDTHDYNSVAYTPADKSVLPGETVFFKTTIKNYELEGYTGSLILENLYVNKELYDKTKVIEIIEDEGGGTNMNSDTFSKAVSFKVEEKYNTNLNEHLGNIVMSDGPNYLRNANPLASSNPDSDTYYIITAQLICKDITIPAGTPINGGGIRPGTFDIVWEFQVNGKSVVNETTMKEVTTTEGDPPEEIVTQVVDSIMGKPLLKFNNMKFVVNE